MTSTSVAGVATLAMFSLVAAFGLSAPSSNAARVEQEVHRLAIAERLAPAPRSDPVPEKIVVAAHSQFAREQRMSFADLMKRWEPLIKKASRRFKVPADWIREVIKLESGGRTMLAENMPMVSNRGARGLMQLLPATYSEMRRQYGLGADPFDPHDNIFAGAAYLSWLRGKYGYPAMFAAYNDGPGNYEQRTAKGKQFPVETQNYLTAATLVLGGGVPTNNASLMTQSATSPANAAVVIPAVLTVAQPPAAAAPPVTSATATPPTPATTAASAAPAISNTITASAATIALSPHAPAPMAGLRQVALASSCNFTETDGSPLSVNDCGDITSVRAPLAGESLPGAQAILSVGVTLHTVRESVAMVRKIVRSHGGRV